MAATDIGTEFIGRRGRVARMSFTMGILTVLTLGFYRFWMKTRLRRYYWSSIRPGGKPLEYVGDPLEKLLGFFIAVVILAFYIGIINLILMFLSFSLFDGNTAAYIASVAGVVPIWFYARYRARRYVYARTRWRGLRFGVDPGAWGYAWRALVHWAITIVTLGLLWPRMTFWLEKYKWDRTWYGDRQFHQSGSWTQLLKGYLPFWIPLAGGVALAFFLGAFGDDSTPESPFAQFEAALSILGMAVIFAPYFAASWAYYTVRSFRILTAEKLAGPVRFVSKARTTRIVWIYLCGYTLVSFLTGLIAVAVAVIYALLVGWAGIFDLDVITSDVATSPDIENIFNPNWYAQAIGIALYFLVFVAWGTFTHFFVTLPRWRHYAETLEILGTESIHEVQQRDRDEHREAEGFAEALDLGAAI